MILKKQSRQPDKKVHPIIGALLFAISLLLLLVTGPLGFIYGIFHSFFKAGMRGLGEYLLKIAVSVDQLGNVLMQYLLNLLWVKKGGYAFGNRDETISSALGRNRQLGTLTGFGLGIDRFLDLIDPNHSLNSIDYYIEPGLAIIDKLSWIHILNGKVLFLKLPGEGEYFLPGGHRDKSKSDAAQLATYLQDLLGIQPEINEFVFLGIFEHPYPGTEPVTFLRQHLYTAPFKGKLHVPEGMEGPFWLGKDDLGKLTLADQRIVHALFQRGLLP